MEGVNFRYIVSTFAKVTMYSKYNNNKIIKIRYNPTPGDISKGMQHRLLQRQVHTHVYCSAIHSSQVRETTKMLHY
jgi:hypothetical protein